MDTHSYLGKKGYTLLKSELTTKEQSFIREGLTVKPYLPKSSLNINLRNLPTRTVYSL